MSRLGGAFWFILVVATGMTNFLVKQNVQNLDDQLTQVRRKTAEDQKKIHDLVADWTFLNQPELLADLNNRYVHLAAMSPKQVVTNLDGIAMRPAPPPEDAAPPPVATVAAPVAPPPAPAVVAVAAVAAPVPATPPHAPVVPVPASTVARTSTPALSLISTAHAATPPAAPAPLRAQPVSAPAAQPQSLDAIFAQVVRDR